MVRWALALFAAVAIFAAGWFAANRIKVPSESLHRGVLFRTEGSPPLIFFPADGGPPMTVIDSTATSAMADGSRGLCVVLEGNKIPIGEAYEWLADFDPYGDALVAKTVMKSIEFFENRRRAECKLPQARRYSGIWIRGFEYEAFRLRTMDWLTGWTVQVSPKDKYFFGGELNEHKGNYPLRASCIDVVGVVTPPGGFGHGGSAQRELIVIELVSSKSHEQMSPDSCKFSGRGPHK